MSPEKLVMMANQIGKFFLPQTNMDAVAAIEDHLRKFWDPRMRKQIIAYLDAGGAALDPPVREAVCRLKAALKQAKTAGPAWL